MTTDTKVPSPPTTGHCPDVCVCRHCGAEYEGQTIDETIARLTAERDAANARAETAERERDRLSDQARWLATEVAAVARAAEWLAERREHGPCAYCPAYHACGPNASPQDCVARLAEQLAAAPAGEEETP